MASTVFATDEVQVQYTRFYQSDISGSCEVCSTFSGVVEVKNLGYQKSLVIHYSDPFYGGWTTAAADYMGPSRNGYELWQFQVPVLGTNKRYYAVEYRVNGKAYWDNNIGSDYQIDSHAPEIVNPNINVLLFRDYNPLILRYTTAINYVGSVYVRDIGYEKNITVRYSLDDWKSWTEAPARFITTADNGLERWGFALNFPLDSEQLSLVVRYEVNGNVYWDNNLGRNYYFKLP